MPFSERKRGKAAWFSVLRKGDNMQREVKKRSAVPVYAAAAVWLIFGLFLPFYQLWHILLAAALSLGVYLIVSRLCPDRTGLVEEKEAPVDTGDRALDAVITKGREHIRRLRALNDAIADERVSAHIDAIEHISDQIFTYVAENPKKAPQIRRFMDYYLPATIKLLTSYDRMSTQGVRGENIQATMAGVEDILGTIESAFAKQLDNLFADEALDISTDITVLEGMMAQEGLTDDGLRGDKD